MEANSLRRRRAETMSANAVVPTARTPAAPPPPGTTRRRGPARPDRAAACRDRALSMASTVIAPVGQTALESRRRRRGQPDLGHDVRHRPRQQSLRQSRGPRGTPSPDPRHGTPRHRPSGCRPWRRRVPPVSAPRRPPVPLRPTMWSRPTAAPGGRPPGRSWWATRTPTPTSGSPDRPRTSRGPPIHRSSSTDRRPSARPRPASSHRHPTLVAMDDTTRCTEPEATVSVSGGPHETATSTRRHPEGHRPTMEPR